MNELLPIYELTLSSSKFNWFVSPTLSIYYITMFVYLVFVTFKTTRFWKIYRKSTNYNFLSAGFKQIIWLSCNII